MAIRSRIYTRSGDAGKTRLGDNRAVPKCSPRVEAYGEVDELNSALGLVLVQPMAADVRHLLVGVQHELFDLGADLCLPSATGGFTESPASAEQAPAPRRIEAAQVRRLEEAIDRLHAHLQLLRSFVLPGGSSAAAHLHLARAVCRRAERRAWELAEREEVNEHALHYLNRLSDLLFVLARTCNDRGAADVLWVPGKRRH